MENDFVRLTLQEILNVDKLISFHYFEYTKGFVFDGEQHDFWELLYVDKGGVEVRADERVVELKQGMIIMHKPGEFHTVRVKDHHKPPNLIVISFECSSPHMTALENVVMLLGSREQKLLSLLMQEGFQAFEPPFDVPSSHELTRNSAAPFASEQATKAYLEILLIQLIRQLEAESVDGHTDKRKPSSIQTVRVEQSIVKRITDYMKAHLSEQLSLDQLCQETHLGKSRLKEIFHSQKGTGVMEYFKLLKIEEAKSLIREHQYNYTEISNMLGYTTIHYFSRDFKKSTGMSPSDYARTVSAHSGLSLDKAP